MDGHQAFHKWLDCCKVRQLHFNARYHHEAVKSLIEDLANGGTFIDMVLTEKFIISTALAIYVGSTNE